MHKLIKTVEDLEYLKNYMISEDVDLEYINKNYST